MLSQVVISCGSEVIARHPALLPERDDFIFDPVHYLPLLEQQDGSVGPGGAPCRVGVA